ncbi:hypothetical protein HanRHA438_Chr07g0314591 [Helianthus annuus]|nr:hypothetical protein HanRHA438_Chr07g0314591 [Helianthus annuus]
MRIATGRNRNHVDVTVSNLSRQNRSSPENQSWPERSSETHSLFTFGSDYRTESFFLSLLVHYFKGISIRNQCELMRTMLRKEVALMPRYTYRR